MASRMYTATQYGTESRPMTSVQGAGLALIESSKAAGKGDFNFSLAKAKQAVKSEHSLTEIRKSCETEESENHGEQIKFRELKFQTMFTLARALERLGRYEEALDVYSNLVKGKLIPQCGRFRVNIGNIYVNQGNLNGALKMFRMALDQLPASSKRLRVNVMRNIGNVMYKMNMTEEAIQTFESILDLDGKDFQAGYNLIYCYFEKEDLDSMKITFRKMVSSLPEYYDFGHRRNAFGNDGEYLEDGKEPEDDFSQVLRARKESFDKFISSAAGLISSLEQKQGKKTRPSSSKSGKSEEKESFEAQGVDWIIQTVKQNYSLLASDFQIYKSAQELKNGRFNEAVSILRSFQSKEKVLQAKSANNLGFISLCEKNAEKSRNFMKLAISHNKYSARVLVNEGNSLILQEKLEEARNIFLEAIGVDSSCIPAIYNLGLVNRKLGNVGAAVDAFSKVYSMSPNCSRVLFHLAILKEEAFQFRDAEKFLNILVTKVPTDPSVLSGLAQVFSKVGDADYLRTIKEAGHQYDADIEINTNDPFGFLGSNNSKEQVQSQALHYFKEAFLYYPVDLKVISWLGVWYVKSEIFEKALEYFNMAVKIEPTEVKWRLMVASCHRRMSHYQEAYEMYEEIHDEFPDNLECLRYLIAISKDLGLNYGDFQLKLGRLEDVEQDNFPRTNHQKLSDVVDAIPSKNINKKVNESIEESDDEWNEDDLDKLLVD
eukprot:maker-scaffold_2-augustus-gene-11.33-mRNA-1 protein AED:0.19 eAED:0.19 QI:0/0/0/0.5/1/1/2/0/714